MTEKNVELIDNLIGKIAGEALREEDIDKRDLLIADLDALIDRRNKILEEENKASSEAAKIELEQSKAEMEASIREAEMEARQELAEMEAETEEAKLDIEERKFRFDRVFKPVKAAAGILIPIAIIHADRIGEFVNKAAVAASQKLFDRD